jgi:PAS domain S-box-containing protein
MLRRSWLQQAAAARPAVTIPLTAVAFYGLYRWGAIAHIDLWLLYLVLAAAGVASVFAERRWPAQCTRRQLHAHVAIDIAATTAVIYAIGWGPTLAIGYVFVVANAFRNHGSRVWQPAFAWTVIGIGLGEAAIALGIAPSIVPEPEVHGLAVLAILGTAFIMRVLGRTTTLKEQAEATVRSSEERFRSLVANASDAVCVVDSENHIVSLTPAIEHITGYPPEEYLGNVGFDFIHPEDMPAAVQIYTDALAEPGRVLRGELRAMHRDGSWRWAEISITNLLGDPAVEGIVANFHDITERKEFEEKLAFDAYHDHLTGLSNRTAFHEALTRALARSRRHGRLNAVLFLDLDRFKLINDSLGHEVGDHLLIEVAARLRTCLRPEDVVSRFGGDEFAVL